MSVVSEAPRRFAPSPARARARADVPPQEVLDEVYAAHERMEELARAGFHVDFARDGSTGRLGVTLRHPAGQGQVALRDVFDLLD
jgi:hypothetical protein